MPAKTPADRVPTDRTLYRAALRRTADILDAAAIAEHVTPDELRAAIGEAIACAQHSSCSGTCSPEAFVLSVLGQLF